MPALDEGYTAIIMEVKSGKATICWDYEIWWRNEHVRRSLCFSDGAKAGGEDHRQRFGCNMIEAITNRGLLAFRVFEGKFQNPVPIVSTLIACSGRSREGSN